MKIRNVARWFLCAGAVLGVWPAWAVHSDIKPGMWETLSQTSLPGGMQMPDMSQLPPEIAAKLAQRSISLQGAGGITARTCISREQALRGEVPPPPDNRCHNTGYARAGNTLSWQVACAASNGRFMSGQGNVAFADPEHYSGSMNITMTEAGRGSMTTVIQMQGRWVGECR